MPDFLKSAQAAGCEPAVLEWLVAISDTAAGLPDLQSLDWPRRRAAARTLSDALATRFTLPGPAECLVTEHRVPSGAGEITVMHYRPPVHDRPRLGHLVMHGGGFTLGTVREVINGRTLRHRAVSGGVDVFDVEYRLAPEHPFPAALDDGVAVLDWLIESAPGFGIDPTRIGVGGVSAGGNLAAMVAIDARDRGIRLDHQLLEVPAASLRIERDPSFRKYAELNDLGGDFSALRTAYLGGDDADRAAAPLEVADLTGLPPTLVITAEFDPLRDCGDAYAAALAKAGVPVEHWCAPRQLHGSGGLTRTSATAREWQDRVGAYLNGRVALATTS